MFSAKELVRFRDARGRGRSGTYIICQPSDDEIRMNILKETGMEPKLIGEMVKAKRDEILRGLKDKYSIRQIERVTGISRGVIFKS